jgi:hypothetical protein
VSVTERDHLCVDRSTALERFASALSVAGLHVESCRNASEDDVQALGSSWARRLGIPRRRAASILAARKPTEW